MENSGEILRIARDQSQRALVIESLETIEQLTGDFQVRFHSYPYEYQLIYLFGRANGERSWSDAGDRKIRRDGCTVSGAGLSLPNGQTVDRTSFEILIFGDGSNHFRKAATALDEVELSGVAVLVCCKRAGDARCIARWIQSGNGSGGADQSRPKLGLRSGPPLSEVCPFELVRVDGQNGIGCLREPFASTR